MAFSAFYTVDQTFESSWTRSICSDLNDFKGCPVVLESLFLWTSHRPLLTGGKIRIFIKADGKELFPRDGKTLNKAGLSASININALPVHESIL